mgnify:FL=1
MVTYDISTPQDVDGAPPQIRTGIQQFLKLFALPISVAGHGLFVDFTGATLLDRHYPDRRYSQSR